LDGLGVDVEMTLLLRGAGSMMIVRDESVIDRDQLLNGSIIISRFVGCGTETK
jgi:hypothetical protein